MANAQIYCSVNELIEDLNLPGDEPRLNQRIREASQFMVRHLGRFIPAQETHTFSGTRCAGDEHRGYRETLDLGEPLLSIREVRVDGAAVTDFSAKPSNRCWANGPYTWLEREAGWGTAVEIDGTWGLYDETEDLETAADQASAAGTLSLNKGSLLSPGMVLLLGDEQELVTAGNGGRGSPAATPATSLLDGAIDNASEEIGVDNGSEFFAGEVLQIETEDLYVRKIGGNRLVCARGWNGTTKAGHPDDTPIAVYRTYKVARGANGTAAVDHTAEAVRRCLPPADVRWLAVQITALMKKKAETGFGGRAGTPETGDTFYINEFPRQINEIQANYTIPYL